MSVPLSLTITDLDNGAHDAIGAKIISDPLTAGVTSYHYGATASVNGGTSLFLAMNDTPMVTYIPETTPLCSLLLALSIVGAVVRPIPKTTCFNT